MTLWQTFVLWLALNALAFLGILLIGEDDGDNPFPWDQFPPPVWTVAIAFAVVSGLATIGFAWFLWMLVLTRTDALRSDLRMWWHLWGTERRLRRTFGRKAAKAMMPAIRKTVDEIRRGN
jgi:hypothetical protein